MNRLDSKDPRTYVLSASLMAKSELNEHENLAIVCQILGIDSTRRLLWSKSIRVEDPFEVHDIDDLSPVNCSGLCVSSSVTQDISEITRRFDQFPNQRSARSLSSSLRTRTDFTQTTVLDYTTLYQEDCFE